MNLEYNVRFMQVKTLYFSRHRKPGKNYCCFCFFHIKTVENLVLYDKGLIYHYLVKNVKEQFFSFSFSEFTGRIL